MDEAGAQVHKEPIKQNIVKEPPFLNKELENVSPKSDLSQGQ